MYVVYLYIMEQYVNVDSDPRTATLVMANKNCKLQTRPLVREGAPHQQTRRYLKMIKKKTKDSSWVPDGYLRQR
jgi:hypothetical protein